LLSSERLRKFNIRIMKHISLKVSGTRYSVSLQYNLKCKVLSNELQTEKNESQVR